MASSALPANKKNFSIICPLVTSRCGRGFQPSAHHVAVEGRRVCIHHEQQLIHRLMKRGNQPPHHPVQVFKLPLTVSHLAHHGAQCCPLQDRDVMRETYLIDSSSRNAAVRPYQSGDSSRNRSSARSRRPSADALHKLLQRQRHQPGVLLWLHHVPAQIQHHTLNVSTCTES